MELACLSEEKGEYIPPTNFSRSLSSMSRLSRSWAKVSARMEATFKSRFTVQAVSESSSQLWSTTRLHIYSSETSPTCYAMGSSMDYYNESSTFHTYDSSPIVVSWPRFVWRSPPVLHSRRYSTILFSRSSIHIWLCRTSHWWRYCSRTACSWVWNGTKDSRTFESAWYCQRNPKHTIVRYRCSRNGQEQTENLTTIWRRSDRIHFRHGVSGYGQNHTSATRPIWTSCGASWNHQQFTFF